MIIHISVVYFSFDDGCSPHTYLEVESADGRRYSAVPTIYE